MWQAVIRLCHLPYLRKAHRLEHLVLGGAVGQIGVTRVDLGPALLKLFSSGKMKQKK